jgi:hypothetical protein
MGQTCIGLDLHQDLMDAPGQGHDFSVGTKVEHIINLMKRTLTVWRPLAATSHVKTTQIKVTSRAKFFLRVEISRSLFWPSATAVICLFPLPANRDEP